MENPSKFYWIRSEGHLGGVLEPSWPQEGAKSRKSSEKLIRWTPWSPPLGVQNWATWAKKSIKNPFKNLLIFWLLFWSIWDWFWKDFGSQNPSKIGEKSIKNAINFTIDFWINLEWIFFNFFAIFIQTHHMARGTKHCKNQWILKVFVFWLLWCWVAFLINFW